MSEPLSGSSVWWSPLLERATDLAPQAGWALGVELVRGGLLLLVIAVAIRAAGGVRGRYRILSAGIVLALLMPLAGMSPGVWRVDVPYEMNRVLPMVEPGPQSEGVAYKAAAANELSPMAPWNPALLTASARVAGSPLRMADESLPSSVSPSVAETLASAAPAAEAPLSALGWTMDDARALGDRATAWIDAAASQPLTWIGLWALGALAVASWGVVGVLRLGVIARQASAADDRWVIEAERVTRRLGIRRPVRVVSSDAVPVPMTWGVFRPIVVVPAMASAWDAERRRVVLTHELVHVRRLDWALQVAAWMVVSLHWCNPLAWWVVRRLAVERERSCDAAVVASGTRPSAYASHLLDIARAMSDVRSPVHALGMAKASELEGRLMSILNGTRRGAKRSVGAAVLVMCAGLAAAAVAPQAVAPQAVPPEKLAELDKAEAELAQLEEKLAAKREKLEAQRAAIEKQALEEYKSLTAEREAERDLKLQESQEHEQHVEPEPEVQREVEPEYTAPENIKRWQKLSQNDGKLQEALSRVELRDIPRLGKLFGRLHELGGELEVRGDKLGVIAERLAPLQEALHAKQMNMEPMYLNLEELQESLYAELAPLQDKLHEMVESPEMQARMEQAQEGAEAMGAEVAAMAQELAAAANAGDFYRMKEIGARLAELATLQEHNQQAAAGEAQEVHEHAQRITEEIHARQELIQAKIHEQMESMHVEMEGMQREMDGSYEQMEGVRAEMDGVHKEMGVFHQKMEKVYIQMEKVIREIVSEIVREAFEAGGIDTDSETGEKIISAASSASGGSRLQITTDDGTELVRITDKGEQFKRMREAIARAEAAGEFKLSKGMLDKIDAALEAAATNGEVLRFQIGERQEGENEI